MSLLDEARGQLEAGVAAYIRAAQQPYQPVLPPAAETLTALGASHARKGVGTQQQEQQQQRTTTATAGTTTKTVKAATATAAAAAATTPSPPTLKTNGSYGSSSSSNPKQARAKLLELVKKFQRATFVTAQVSKDEATAGDGGGSVSRRGTRMEGMSRQQSVVAAIAASTAPNGPSSLNATALPALAASVSGSRPGSKKGAGDGRLGQTPAAAVAAPLDATSPGLKRADMRDASLHPLPSHAGSVVSATRRSQSNNTRRYQDTERSLSVATSAAGRERSASPSSAAAAHSATALRRLEASLAFTRDCLRYAETFADAGLTQEAQTCFLQLVAPDVNGWYEPMVTRCVERRTQPGEIAAAAAAAAAAKDNAHGSQQQEQNDPASSSATSQAAIRRRSSKGKGARDSRKHNAASLSSLDGSSQPSGTHASAAQRLAEAAAGAVAGEEALVAGHRVTDTLDVFASDVPLPLALRVYKCVLRYRALLLFIKFRELLQTDAYGDAAGMATGLAACACVEDMVALQQRVLHTATFSAAVVLSREEARMREDVSHSSAAKPVQSIVIAGGCKLVDVLAEPAAAKTAEASLAAFLDGPTPLFYAVDEVAAPVLLTMRLYVAKMCEQLAGFVRGAITDVSRGATEEARTAVHQRCLDALRASASMSELHLRHAKPPAAVPQSPDSTKNAASLYDKTCLPLAAVEYVPWRLQEYALLQQTYLQLEDGSAGAVVAAERALLQVLQLMELEHLDPVPPPATTTVVLDAAVQQCAAWLLVATWRAAIAHGSSSVSAYAGLATATAAGGGGGDGAAASSAFAASSPQSGPLSPSESMGSAQPSTHGDAAAALGGDGAAGAAGGVPAAVTARCAMAAITAAVQRAVAFLVASPAAGLPATTTDVSARRGSRKSGSTPLSSAAAHKNSSSSSGSSPSAVDGTRLLVVLWTCMAQVQQQCSLVAGRSVAADALAAAASDVAYAEAQESMWATEAAQGTNSTPPPNAAGTVSPAKSPSPARKANAAPKQATAAAPPPPAASDGDASGPVDPSAAAASVTSSSPLSSAHLIRPPAELRHSHPAVLELSRRFPRMALELLGKLVSVVEAAGAVPQALPYNPTSRTHAPASQRYGDAAVSGGAAKSSAKAGSEAADRKAAKGGRQRASSVAVSGGNDSLNGSYGGSGGGGVNPAATAFRTRVLHSVYRGCVDGFEALLHAAAVRSERAWTAEEEEETSRLSVRTRATAWSDAVDVLGYCDETETEVSAVDAGDGADASHDRSSGAAQQQQQLPSSSPLHSLAAFPAAACFLFNPADTRCLLRWNSWETLFTVAGDPLHELPGPGGAALSFTAKSLADAGLVRAVAVLRTLTFSSTRAVLTVRIGVALEAWWRAQLSPAAKKTAAAAPTSTGAAVSIDCALRCLQLLRAVLLASLLHQTQQRQQQPSSLSSRQASTRAKESPLASLLRAFDAAAAALDVRVPAAVRTTVAQPAPAPEAAGDEATRDAAPSPSLSSVPPAPNSADAEAEQYRLLSAQAQTSLLLTLWQRQSTPLLPAPTVALHELCEADEDGGGDAETATLPSMALLRVSAALMEKTTAALCPGADAHLTAAQPLQGSSSSSSSGGGAGHSASTPPTPSCASLMLQPIVADAAAFLLRCSESLRSQWQRQRTRRRLRQSGTAAAAAASPATATVTAGSRSSTHGATAAAPLSATALLEETEAREEAHYATIVLCVLSSLWRSGGVGSGAPQLEERAVAAVTRRVSTGFLQLLPTESAGGVRDGSGGGVGLQCRIAPLPLARLIAHGSSVRRLLELTRTHLQHHVESLLRHAAPVTAATNPRGHHHGHHRVPHSLVAVTAAQLQCQRRLLVTARDGLTELTQLWVTVRWQLARLHVHRSDYAARHVDLETLQQRHDQQQVYGRPSAKELRILHTLEHDAPVLPNTAKEEEVRLLRWVKDQQNAAIGSPLAPSLQLLEALVCAALVPLNATDPAAQQKLVDEAIRALTEAEKAATTTTSAAAAVAAPASTAAVATDGLGGGSSTTEAMHRPGSSRVGGGGGVGRGTHAQLSAIRHTTAITEPPFLFTPVLLWCYLAEACSGCGTAAQTAQVRGVLDRQLLMESPALVEADMGSAAAVVTMTAPFTQQLFLHPRWAVLEDCSATTRVAFCRALSALATDDRAGPSSSSSSSSSALGSLQNSYRLLLALQIQQLPEPAVTAAGVPSSSVQSPSVTDKKKMEATSAAHHHHGGDGGSPPTAAAVSTSLLTLSAAQHLLASITLYLSRSAGGSAAPRGGSPSAAVLLPLLVELCTVLLRLPASSPQWGDGEMQLLALRVLTLFKQQQLAVLAASPSPLTTQSAAAAVAGSSATAAAAASTVLMDSFLQLLWATFAHVWNSVFRNPTARQRRYLHETTSATQWARQVLQQHRRRGAGAGGDDGDGGSGDGGGHPPSRQGRGNAANAAGAPSDGTSPDSAAARSSTSADGSADPLVFPGMAYLPPSDNVSPSESSGSTAANVAPSPAAHGAGDGTDGDAAEKRGAVAATTAGASTVLLHASMPSEYMELLEDILLHLPALWPLILSPPSSITIPAVATALSRAGGGGSRPASPQPHTTEKESGVASMHTPYDFVVYAALQAVKTLREAQRSAVDAAAPSGGERRLSTGAHSTAGGQLKGLSSIYLDVVAALQQYATAMTVAAAAAPTANGGTAANNNNNSSSSAQQGGSGAAAGGRAGGNARSQAASLAAPAVSAACMTLMDALQAHADDPAYAKLAAHVVREMLALCNDDYVSANLSGPATPPGAAAGAGASTGKGKKTPAAAAATTSAAAAGAEGSMGGYRGSGGAVSAAAVTTDVRHVIQNVREHVQKNQRAMRAFLAQVDVETQAWLTRGGFNLAGQMQQQQQQQQQDQQQQLDGTTAEAGGAAGKAKAAAAAAAPKKAAKKPGKKGAAGGKGNRADAADEGEGDEKEDGDGANGTGAGHSGSSSSSSAAYSTVTRVFTFTEEQKLKQLTCGIAHWRRSRVGRLLRQRYVQYNTAYVAQLHVVEAALLHMGERFRRLAWRQESLVHELLTLTEASPEGHEGTGSGAAAAAAAAARAGASGGSRGSPRDKKKAMTTASTPAATALSSASTNTNTDRMVACGPGEELTGELSAHVTEELLHHCVRASNLFQYVWLPSRASAVVQLAVTHLRFAPLPGPADVPLGLPVSQQQQQQQSSSSRQSTSAWLLTQLLMVPLFSLSAVLQGYYDAGRDVHASLLQPTTVKAGAAVALARSAEFVRTVPSLFTLASPAGQQSEEATAELARRQVAQQHRYELLRQRWCVEAEAATRAEATRDEVQDRVRILQQAQELLPASMESTALKERMVSAADLLSLMSAPRKRAGQLTHTSSKLKQAKATTTAAAASRSVLSREAAHAAAVASASAVSYTPFDGACGAPARRTLAAPDSAVADASRFGQDMAEARLVEQLTSLGGWLERHDRKTAAAAYRAAQQLTGGRHALEVLPCLMRVEEQEEEGDDATTTAAAAAAAATQQAYEKARHSVADGVRLLRSARAVRRQWMSSSPSPLPQLGQLGMTAAAASTRAEAGRARSVAFGQGSTAMMASDGSALWRAAVEAYETAAQALRSGGLLQLLGECLYELGELHYAAPTGKARKAATQWSDALDCFLSTPHVFDDWHARRSVPPPSSTRRGLTELVWMTAALTALADKAFAGDVDRATDAQLLCALLVHQHWRLPAVVAGPGADNSTRSPLSSASQPLPAPLYAQLDVTTIAAALRSSGSEGKAKGSAPPESLPRVVRALLHSAHLLVQREYSAEASVLGAFADYLATVQLQQAELAVEARLVRATAAASLGSFGVAMRHLHSVCVGWGLPQPLASAVGVEYLPGYYSIAAAAARLAPMPASSSAAGAGGGGAAAGAGKKPAAGGATTAAAATTTNTNATSGSPGAAALPSASLGAAAGGGGAGGAAAAAASLAGAATTVLPASVASLFFFYRDSESPSSPHNTAAIRAFLLACLPGWTADATSAATTTTAAAAGGADPLPLTRGLLNSAALEQRYGVLLLRKLCLAVAEVLVLLGTSDPAYLLASPPASLHAAAALPPPPGADDATAHSSAAAPPATSTSGGNSGRRRSSASGAPRVGSAGASAAAAGAPLFSAPGLPALVAGARPTNACTEACRFALLLLRSLRHADVRFALVGQPSTASSSGAVGGGSCNDGDGASDSPAASAESAVWLDSLGAVRQWAVLLTGGVYAAQGRFEACLQLLSAAVAEYQDSVPVSQDPAAGDSGEAAGVWSASRGHAVTPVSPSSLSGYGLHGARSGHGSGAALPLNFTCVHWMRVWRLLCRCYSQLRQYAQLESAAGVQGRRVCEACGEASTQRHVFALYHVYALTQMGRVAEATAAMAALQPVAARLVQSDASGHSREAWGLTDDGSVAAAVQWWQRERHSAPSEAGTGALNGAASLAVYERIVAHQTRVAVLEKAVLPWAVGPAIVLDSPNARAVLPLCATAGFAKTREVWRLHHSMAHYAFQLQRHAPPAGAVTHDAKTAVALSGYSRTPQPPSCVKGSSGGARTQAPAAASSSQGNTLNDVMAGYSPSTRVLCEAQEALCPQYAAQAHPAAWLLSQLLVVRLRARAVCALLSVKQHREGGGEDDGDSSNDEDGLLGGGHGSRGTATVEFAVRINAPTPQPPPATPADLSSRLAPLLDCPSATLEALPTPVRQVCEELLELLRRCVELPVQQHAMVRILALDLAAVVAAYIRAVRARRTRPGAARPRTGAAVQPALLVPQLEAVVAGCTLLAGLVTDMERRVRTGAESLRGYQTDPRLNPEDAGEALAQQLQAQWPELLCTAVQQTHENVGQLSSTSPLLSGGTRAGATAAAITHPFYDLTSLQQQQQQQLLTAAGGAAEGADAKSSSTSKGKGPAAAAAASSASPFTPTSTATAAPMPMYAAATASPLISVPTLALTFAALTDEAAALDVLAPVSDALEHDAAVQLLTSHLQALSPPLNCTYLCYRDDMRQQLLEAVAGAMGQQHQQLQQQQLLNRPNQRRISAATSKKVGAGGSSGTATGAGANVGSGGGGAAGPAAVLALSETDVWKALLPPVLLSAVPPSLFTSVGPDSLGAPLYNSVAAAAVAVPLLEAGDTPAFAAKASPAGATTWQLFLSVSPLHDARRTEAPSLPGLLSPQSSASLAAEVAALLPPAPLVAALNEANSATDAAGGAAAGGAAGASSASAAFAVAAGSAGGGAAAASARGRGPAKPSGPAAAAAQRNSNGQDYAGSGGGVAAHAGDRNAAGCVWPPPLSATATAATAACLVPSTNWPLLDQIQRDTAQVLSAKAPPTNAPSSSAAAKAASTTSTAAPAFPATGASTVAMKAQAGGKGGRTANTVSTSALSTSASLLSASGPEGAKAAAAAEAGPVPLRWTGVSLQLSDATMQSLRRHLSAVLQGMHQARGDTDGDEDTAAAVSPGAAAAAADVAGPAAVEAEAAQSPAPHNALAAAVSRAQLTLRTHLAAAGVAAAGFGATNTVSSSSMASGAASSAFAAGPGTSGGAGGGGGGAGGGSGGAAAGGAQNSAAGGLASTLRKPGPRVGNAANTGTSTNTAGRRISGGYGDVSGSAAGTGGGAAGLSRATGGLHDDLAEEARVRQTAERSRQRLQHAEELEELKAGLLRELLEAIVAASATAAAAAAMDEARVEHDVRRLLPRCPLTPSVVEFLCEWLGGVSVSGVEAAESTAKAMAPLGSSGHTSLRFYHPGLHEWMQRVAQYVSEQQQQRA